MLAGSLLFLTPTLAEAAGRGGFHGGGFHGGGFHGGHFGGARVGGYRGGYYHRGFYGRPYAGRGYHGYYGGYGGYGGFYPYFGAYAGYPFYGSYGYNEPYSYPLATAALDSGYVSYMPVPLPGPSSYASADPGAFSAAESSVGQYQPPDVPAVTPPDVRAHLTVTVPAGAQLRVDDTPLSMTGTVREFQTPPLRPGGRYGYTVKASWDDHGHEVTQTQEVDFTAGDRVSVRFPTLPGTAAPAPAVTRK
jgi:uncharacterized protein (TIGR03000 family)